MLIPLALIGMNEALIVLVVVLVLFGGKKIPELLRGVGQGVGELQKGLEEGKRQLHTSIQDTQREEERRRDQFQNLEPVDTTKK